jgi:hypothetical protein
MGDFSWWPGLPSLGPKYDMWAVDPTPETKPVREFLLLFLVVDNGESAQLLANRTGRDFPLEDYVFIRHEHEKEYMTIGKRRLLLKRWSLKSKKDVEEDTGDKIRTPPSDICGILPPREFTPADINQLATLLS